MALHRALLSSMLFIYLFISFTEARELLVGGNSNAWKIPSSESESLNKWAEASRFQIGDSLGTNTIPKIYSLFFHISSSGSCLFDSRICILIWVLFCLTVWNYDPSKDSVVQVSKKDYDSCSTSSPIAVYKDGNTKVKLDKSGPFYFISGAEGQCEKGQKLVTVVLSGRHGFFHLSPAPSPVEFEGPAVAPTSGGTSLRGGFMVIFGVLVGLLLF